MDPVDSVAHLPQVYDGPTVEQAIGSELDSCLGIHR